MSYRFNPLTGSLDLVSDPAGSSGDVQLNLSGGFGAVTGFKWVTGELQVPGDLLLEDGGTYKTTLSLVTPTANRTVTIPDASGTMGFVAGSSGQIPYNASGAYAEIPSSSVDGATGAVTLARLIAAANGAASTPPVVLTGTWFTGGTNTTTKPALLIEPAGTTSAAWSTSGTGLGVNAPSGFTGRLLDLQLNGASEWAFGVGVLTVGDANDIAVGTTTGTKIGTATTQKLGFFNATPVVQPAEITDELTTITHTAPGTPDYAIQNLTDTNGFGFATADEGNTVLSVIANLQARVNDLELRLVSLGLLADAD